jgi:hypothetical protein
MFIMTKIQLQIESLFFKFLLMLVDPNEPDVIVKNDQQYGKRIETQIYLS